MTKQDFDTATKVNYGGTMDDRTDYRMQRGQAATTDVLASRAADMQWWNAPAFIPLRGGRPLPTLGRESSYRAIAEYNRSHGLPLLEGIAAKGP